MKGVRRFERRCSEVWWNFVKRHVSRPIPPWLQCNSMTSLSRHFAVLVDGASPMPEIHPAEAFHADGALVANVRSTHVVPCFAGTSTDTTHSLRGPLLTVHRYIFVRSGSHIRRLRSARRWGRHLLQPSTLELCTHRLRRSLFPNHATLFLREV